MSWSWQLYLYLSRYAGCASSNHPRHFNLIEQSVRSSWEISRQPYRGYTAINGWISLLATALEDALLCWGSFLQNRPLLPPRYFYACVEAGRLLLHGTALYCSNTTVCTVESAHNTLGVNPATHYTYRTQRYVNGQILLPRTSPLAGNSGVTTVNTMT